jgi:peptide/nickel transport system substrate-binding protein
MPAILLTLSTNPAGAIISPDAFENEDLSTNPVGSGPYTFDTGSFVDGSFYAYDVRDGYWDPSLQHLERIEYTVFAEVEARYNAIAADQVDMAPADITYVEDAEAQGLEVVRNPVDWLGLVLFDRDGTISEAIGDVRVRQAMNYAVDREAILETVALGAGHITTQIYPQNSPAYLDELDARYPYDPEMARQLLTDAGYPDGFEFETPAFADSTYLEALAGYLADVGIIMNLNVVDGNAYVDAFISGDYPAAYFSFGSEHPSQDNANMILPGASLNVLNTTDQEVVDLDAQAARASGDEQVALWQQINTKITEEAWFLVTHAADSILLVNSRVTGTTPYVNQDSLSIYEWGIEE